jgi:hypothetical protein
MEKTMKNPFFTVDAVLDTKMRQIAVFAGYTKEIQPISFKVADKRTYVPFAEKKFDVMIFGMPQKFHYGNGHGTNPLLMLQAISANIIRHKRVLSDNCVVIVSSICNGYFHDEEFPSYRPVYELFQKDYHNILPDVNKYGEYFARNQEYIDKYRYNYGYHPVPCVLDDLVRAHCRNALFRHLHRRCLRTGLCPRHGHEDARHL